MRCCAQINTMQPVKVEVPRRPPNDAVDGMVACWRHRLRRPPCCSLLEIEPIVRMLITIAQVTASFWKLVGPMRYLEIQLQIIVITKHTNDYDKEIILEDGLTCSCSHFTLQRLTPRVNTCIFVVEQLVQVPHKPCPYCIKTATCCFACDTFGPASQKELCVSCLSCSE